MRLHLSTLIAIGVLLSAPVTALAQSNQQGPDPNLPLEKVPVGPPPSLAQIEAAAPKVPELQVYGVAVRPDAPVSPAYDGTAYRTFAGQAETGEDAISEQQVVHFKETPP